MKKTLKVLLFVFVILPIFFIAIGVFFSEPEPKYDNQVSKYAKTNLNVRRYPELGAKVLKVISPNEKVIVYDSIVNGFTLILNRDSTEYGWASNKYLQNQPLTKNQLKSIKKKESQNKIIQTTNETTPKFTILKEDKNNHLKKVNIDVRLDKEINKIDLKKISLKIKESRPKYEKFWIYYYLPEHKIGNGAWATTHFTPKLEIRILGVTKESMQELDKKNVTGNIVNVWKDNDAIMPCKIYLINENNNFIIKSLFAKNSFSDESEIIEKVIKSEKNGEIRFTSNNPHGEYYVLEKNGNLGLYNSDGKFKEAVKLE